MQPNIFFKDYFLFAIKCLPFSATCATIFCASNIMHYKNFSDTEDQKMRL